MSSDSFIASTELNRVGSLVRTRGMRAAIDIAERAGVTPMVVVRLAAGLPVRRASVRAILSVLDECERLAAQSQAA